MLNLTDIEKGYIAGIIDGEGCIFIAKSPNYGTIGLTVTNTREELVQWFYTRLGGSVYKRPYTHRKPIFIWRVRNKQAIELISSVYSFLVIKKKQAQIAIDAYREIHEQQELNHKQRLSSGQRAERLKSYKLMREANA